MKLITMLTLLFAANFAQANPFPEGDAKAGKALFDKYNCNQCHSQIVGGSGDAIFSRKDRKVTTPDELVAQIKVCSGNVGASFNTQQVQHLGAYLNKFYKFK